MPVSGSPLPARSLVSGDPLAGAFAGRSAPWLGPVLGAALALLISWGANVADRDESRALARRELPAILTPGESVWQTVPAAEQDWHELFRATYGILAVTNRRVLFVGARPENALPPDGTRAIAVESFPYDDTGFTIAPARIPPVGAGVRVTSAEDRRELAVAPQEHRRLRSLVALATRRAAAIASARARAERFRDSVAALPPLREYYTVRRGDALVTIARRYGTTAARLRTLNHLADDRILVGQELLVREVPRPIPPCPPTICGIITASTGEIESAPGPPAPERRGRGGPPRPP